MIFCVLLQDENWGENTTAVTGNTSEQSGSNEDVSQWANESEDGFSFACQKFISSTVTWFISVAAFLSPLAMVALPKLGLFKILKQLKQFLNLQFFFQVFSQHLILETQSVSSTE